jgi:hypothetical protein
MIGFIYVSALSVLVVLAVAALLNSSLGARLRNSVRQRLGLEINRVVSEIDNRSAIASGKVDGWQQQLNPFQLAKSSADRGDNHRLPRMARNSPA